MMAEQESQNGNASVAWFKLADLIARKEREKALNVYRLLSHSLQDRAYALQLEGDVLWSLDDRSALERYKQAAFLYQKDKRWVEAIAIYEHLLTIEQDNDAVLATLIPCYAMANWHDIFQDRIKQLCTLVHDQRIAEQQFIKIMQDIIGAIQETEDHGKQQWLHEQLDTLTADLPPHIRQALIK
jgi:tetratricopeptide (TPR) repeat protein